MEDKKKLAQHLYMTQCKSQKEVAQAVGVSERTVYTWVHQYAWDKLKLASYQAPATISENLCCQLIELQNAVARREPGLRYPNPEEADTTRKLINCFDKMKKYPSLSQNMQMLETFKNFIRPIDEEFARKLGNYSHRFLAGKSVNGFAPYQMEYGIEQVAPVMTFDDEPENTDPAPCPDIDTCLHPGQCEWPHCKHTKQWHDSISSDPLKQNSVTPVPAITEEERIFQYNIFMRENGFPETPKPASNPITPTTETTNSSNTGLRNSTAPLERTAEATPAETPETTNSSNTGVRNSAAPLERMGEATPATKSATGKPEITAENLYSTVLQPLPVIPKNRKQPEVIPQICPQ